MRLIKRLADSGGRGIRGGGGGAGPSSDQLAAATTADGAAASADPLTAATALPLPTFRHQPPPLPKPIPRMEWGLVQVPECGPEYQAWAECVRNVSGKLDHESAEVQQRRASFLLLGCGLITGFRPFRVVGQRTRI